jgi:deoxycytidylate deaminase
MSYTQDHALQTAIIAASGSGCAKSQRGVAIFHRQDGLLVTGTNRPPGNFRCDGSEGCRRDCNKLCIHAEQDALSKVTTRLYGWEMLHVKVVNGEAVPSGPPSCWQCSRIILAAQLNCMWLLHEDGLRSYTVAEFHGLTLKECGLYSVIETQMAEILKDQNR